MKIIQITPYYPPHLGGMENVAKEISERLAQKGHQVEVVTSNIGCETEKLRPFKNLKISHLKSWELAHTPLIPSLFFKLIKIPKDSIIHMHIAQAFVPEIVWLVSKLKGVPYVAHIHIDVGPSGKMGFLLPFYKRIFLKKVLNSSSRIIVPSEDYIALICDKNAISVNKICKISNGIDIKNFKVPVVKSEEVKNLLFVGRLSKQKNVPLLIKAFKILTEKNYKNVKLNIVGDGEEKNNIISLIKEEKLEKNIILHGELHGRKLYDIYSDSDIFILTSSYESFGLVLIEAMASGLPIVASNIPSVKNIIENSKSGLLVTPLPNEFATAIERLLKNTELRKKLIKHGLIESRKYNWDKIIEKFESVYLEVLYENK